VGKDNIGKMEPEGLTWKARGGTARLSAKANDSNEFNAAGGPVALTIAAHQVVSGLLTLPASSVWSAPFRTS